MFWFYSAKEEGERKVKPLSWKKMMMGREVVFVSVGTKRRNQRLREGSTMMSEDLMPFMGLGFGLALMLRRERERERQRIRQLMVLSDWWKALVIAERAETEIWVFHGRTKE